MSRGGPPPVEPRLLLDAAAITFTVQALAAELGAAHGDDSVVVSVLKGALVFTSDLLRALPFHPLVDFVAMSTYEGGQRVRLVKDLTLDIAGAQVIVVQDVIDTGLSTSFLLGELARRHPRSLSLCTLIDKPDRHLVPLVVDHVGHQVDDAFLIGYGLDFAGRYRNLDRIAVADLAALSADPDCYRAWAHPGGS